ncbi:PRC-barrel domain-containing protein, partial [Streptomyces albidoflavus]
MPRGRSGCAMEAWVCGPMGVLPESSATRRPRSDHDMTAGDSFLTTDQLVGLTAYDRDGAKVGSVEQVFLDDATGKPEWVTVKTGMFGMKETFVPLAGAGHDGEGLHLAYAKDTIKDAPRVDADEHLDAAEERELYAHYGVTRGGSGKTGEEMSGRTDTSGKDTGMDTGTKAAAA